MAAMSGFPTNSSTKTKQQNDDETRNERDADCASASTDRRREWRDASRRLRGKFENYLMLFFVI